MKEFIIVTKPIRFGWGILPYITNEIKRLLLKRCNLEIKYNKEGFILVREIDDSVFLDTELDVVSYISQNRLAINIINNNYTKSIDLNINDFNSIEKINNIKLNFDFM